MSWVGLLLHAVLMLAAAPVLDMLVRRVGAAWRGYPAPPLAQPVRDLVRLWRKQVPLPSGASLVFTVAPAVSLAAAAGAVLLVPSFTLGMATGGIGDLVVVAVLLAASEAALSLAAHDAGSAVVARHTPQLGALPVVVLAGLALVLASGSTNLDAAVASVRDGGVALHLAGLMAGAALLAVAAVRRDVPGGFGGRSAALVALAGQARFLGGVALATAVALPFGVAGTPGGWAFGVICWVAKMGAMAVLALALRPVRVALPAGALLAMAAVAVASVQGRA